MSKPSIFGSKRPLNEFLDTMPKGKPLGVRLLIDKTHIPGKYLPFNPYLFREAVKVRIFAQNFKNQRQALPGEF